jgi:alkylation response protein AidB-like acyl-CoA dehydrogenase
MAIRAVLVRVPAPGLQTSALETLGLRGARIGELSFTDVPIAAGDVLGRHLPVTRRGIWGAIKAFDNVRVQVAAMALGTALAVVEYVRDHRRSARAGAMDDVASFGARIEAVRQLIYRAATDVDSAQGRGHLSSLAKLEAVELAQLATRRLPALLGRGALLEHPLLEKWRRDALGFEMMEGTAAIHRLNIAEGRLRTTPVGAR